MIPQIIILHFPTELGPAIFKLSFLLYKKNRNPLKNNGLRVSFKNIELNSKITR